LLALSSYAFAQPERLLSRPLEQGDLETTIHEADSVSRPALLLETGSSELLGM